ncbi:MAG: transporter ATP-binding protein [Acidimicrobiales bacterium]|nr:transporter ATP-binding protein [Acidimicrobiales bacterium]
MSDQPTVRARDASRTFGRGASAVVAVHGVSCDIEAGARIALTGPSGSGKTTLLHLLAGLDVPTTGSVDWPAIGGRTDLRPGAVAVVFQAPSLIPSLNVIENVALPLLLQGVDRTAARVAAMDALTRLSLIDLMHSLPEELSGGQSQRVAAARVMAGRPRLILADEPTGQLDRVNGLLVVEALIRAADRSNAALVVNTHDPDVAAHLDQIWSMSSGRLLQREPARR